MSKILKSTSKLLDDAISLLETEVQRQTMELTALKRAREALASPRSAPKVSGRYRATPTVKLAGKTQRIAFSFVSKNGTITNKQLSQLAGNTEKSASNCLSVLVEKGIMKRVKPGMFEIK